MATGTYVGSAEIIQFPVRFRSPGSTFETRKQVDLAPKRIYDAAFSSSWYHEAALEDAQGPKS